jgi:hypothetical protein
MLAFGLCAVLALGRVRPATANPHITLSWLERQGTQLGDTFAEFAAGLEHRLKTDDVAAAADLYVFERSAVALLETSARVPAQEGIEREGLQAELRSLLSRVLRLQDRLREHTTEVLDRVLPGEPPQQHWAREGNDLYHPLFRLGTPTPGAPPPTAAQAFAEMKRKAVKKGIKPQDFHNLTPSALKSLESGVLAEWVQLGHDIRLTTSGAKHPVIGKGKSGRGAGSMKVYKDTEGEVLLAVVSNSSGNYKPGPGSTEGPVQRLIDLGVDEGRILVTSIVPQEPELVKLLLKSKRGIPEERIKEYAGSLRDQVDASLYHIGLHVTVRPELDTIKPPSRAREWLSVTRERLRSGWARLRASLPRWRQARRVEPVVGAHPRESAAHNPISRIR